MTTYATIADSEIDPESPGTTTLFTKLRNNPLAIQEGDATAPDIQAGAYAIDSISVDKIDFANSAGLSQVSYSQEAYNTTGSTAFVLVEDEVYVYIPANANTFSYHGIGYIAGGTTCEWQLRTDTKTGTTAAHGTATPDAQTGTLDVSDKTGWTKIQLYLRTTSAGDNAHVYRITGTLI